MAAPPIVERHLHHFHRRSPIKESVRVAATGDVNTSTGLNVGDTVDGVTLADGDRVLLPAQSTGSQNGLWVAGATPARAYDQSTDDPAFGFLVYVREGTANAGTLWANTNTSTPTIGSTSLTFARAGGGASTASAVSITDAGGYLTATDVEAALQELAKKDIGYTAHGNTGATETFDALTGWHSATLDADCTFTFTGATSGLVAAMVLELAQDGTGSRLVTWPGSVVWAGSAPTLSTGAGDVDILTFFSRDGGTTWYGFPTGGSGVSGGTPALTLSTTNSAGVATTAILTDATIAVFDATVPVTQAFGDSAATGSAGFAARRDHVHGMPATPATGVGEIVISDVHSTPLVFADLVQTEAEDDLVYADL